MKILVALAVLPLCGCLMGGGSMAKIVKELAKDPATVRLRFPTPYGVFELDRYVPGSNSPPPGMTIPAQIKLSP